MSDTAPEMGTSTGPEMGSQSSEMGGDANHEAGIHDADWRAEAEKYRALMRKEEARAKASERELAKAKRDAMSESERTVAEAVAAAQAETAAEVTARLGGRLVIAEIRGAVAGRLPNEAVTALTERLDLSTFLTGDGEVDGAAVKAFAEQLAPEVNAPQTFPDLGQGARPSSNGNPLNDPLLRDLKGKLGITF